MKAARRTATLTSKLGLSCLGLLGLGALGSLAHAEPRPLPPSPDFPPPVDRNGVRLRSGLGLELGGGGGEEVGVIAGALSVRGGLQWSPLLATYFQPRLLLGGALDEGFLYGGQFALLAELALPKPVPGAWQRSWLLAIGPAADVRGIPYCECPSESPSYGAEARLSVGLLEMPMSGVGGARSGFFWTLAAHPTWTKDGLFLLDVWAGLALEAF